MVADRVISGISWCYEGFVSRRGPMVAEWVENGALGETEFRWSCGVHLEAGGILIAQ